MSSKSNHFTDSDLIKNSEMLEAIIKNVSESIIIFDNQGRYVYLNNSAKKYDKILMLNEVDFKTRYEKLPPFNQNGDLFPINEVPENLLLSGESFKDMIIGYDYLSKRLYFKTHGVPIFNKVGNFENGIIFFHNISVQISNELLVIKQNERLEALLSSITDSLLLIDENSNITFLNPAAKVTKKYFSKTDVKTNFADSIKLNKYRFGIDGDEMKVTDLPIYKVLNEGSFQSFIITIDDGEKVYLSINGSPITIKDGNTNEALLVIRDITSHINLLKITNENAMNDENLSNEALKSTIEVKDEFLSTISHEFKTPLNVINSVIQALELNKNEFSENAIHLIERIKVNTYRQMRLVDNLLYITKFKAGYVRTNNSNVDIVVLTKKIIKAVRLYSARKGIYLIFSCNFEHKMVCIDAEKYQRILLNLLSNAIKFTTRGKVVYVIINSCDSELCITVEDTGVGIPKEKQSVIFDRFVQVESLFSRRAEGLGIGLFIVNELVKLMGAKISLKSEVGTGSVFTIRYPLKNCAGEFNHVSYKKVKYNNIFIATQIEFSDLY